jgi:hypothetical protein
LPNFIKDAQMKQKTGGSLRREPFLRAKYRGQTFIVQVDHDGFEYQGQHYRSLSAITRQITGTRWNGLAFFHLTERRRG